MYYAVAGSPPRMRGKEFQVVGHTDTPGITPAYAGKRQKLAARIGVNRDHPRVCGEKGRYCVLKVGNAGSPPRMRGKEGQPGRRGL